MCLGCSERIRDAWAHRVGAVRGDGKQDLQGQSAAAAEAAVALRQADTQAASPAGDDTQWELSGETATLRIDHFRRPFTLNAVQAFVQQIGPMEEGGFWMDRIKTHCFVTFASVDVARRTKDVIHGVVWPPETGQRLSVGFSQVTAMEVVANGPPPPDSAHASLKRKASSDEIVPRTRVIRGRGAPASMDSLFRKTEAKPMLYFVPVADEQVAARQFDRERRRQLQQQQQQQHKADAGPQPSEASA